MKAETKEVLTEAASLIARTLTSVVVDGTKKDGRFDGIAFMWVFTIHRVLEKAVEKAITEGDIMSNGTAPPTLAGLNADIKEKMNVAGAPGDVVMDCLVASLEAPELLYQYANIHAALHVLSREVLKTRGADGFAEFLGVVGNESDDLMKKIEADMENLSEMVKGLRADLIQLGAEA